MINLFQPVMGDPEMIELGHALKSNWVGAGPRLDQFLDRFAKLINVRPDEITSVASCTEGLFQIMEAFELRPGDEVVLPSISFVGAANAVMGSGGTVVLCDVDPLSLNPTADMIASVLTDRTRAVVILHYGGHPGDVAGIASLCRNRGIQLVEDTACAVGSSLDGQMCGTFGDMAVWSFDAMKTVVTGDGGVVRASNPEIAERIRLGTFLGLDGTGIQKLGQGPPWWVVNPRIPGRRARMNDISAAIGLAQLDRLPQFLLRRREIAAIYSEELAGCSWLRPPPQPDPGAVSSWYFYWIQMESGLRDALAQHLIEQGIYSTFRYWPLHRTDLFRQARPLPNADAAAAQTLLLPMHAGLTDDDIGRVMAGVRSFNP